MSKNDETNTSPKKDNGKTKDKEDVRKNIKEEKPVVKPAQKSDEKKTISSSALSNKKVEDKKKEEKVFPQKKTVEKPMPTKTTSKTSAKTAEKDVVAKIKKKPNYILIAGIIVILIPCIFLGYLLLGSQGNSDEPVEGSRFKHSLDPEISDSEVTAFKDSLSFDSVDNIDVSLKSATLRININANDAITQDEALALLNTAYEAAIAKFPVETYFTNKTNSDESITKMYDLQVTVYNYIGKTDEEKEGQIQIIRTKNAAAESDVVDIVSTPKNPDVTENLLNPDTSQIPESEGE